MFAQRTTNYHLCRMVADGLKDFAAQRKPFHEWRSTGGECTDTTLLGLFFVLDSYDAKTNTLALYDFEPGGCTRGTPTYYHQKEEAVAAIENSLVCGGNAGSPEVIFDVVRSVLGAPYREKTLRSYFDKAINEVARIGEKDQARVIAKLGLEKFRVSLEDAMRRERDCAIASLEPPENSLLIVDTFLRRLYIECDDKRDTPDGFRVRAGLGISS